MDISFISTSASGLEGDTGEPSHAYRLVAPAASVTLAPVDGAWVVVDAEPSGTGVHGQWGQRCDRPLRDGTPDRRQP